MYFKNNTNITKKLKVISKIQNKQAIFNTSKNIFNTSNNFYS